jgi:lipid A 3-O-deacylase
VRLGGVAAVSLGQAVAVQAADVSFSVGQTGDSTQVYRLGLQSNWDSSWWQTRVGA